jgi:hypothetical protein
MKTPKHLILALAVGMLLELSAGAQAPYLFRITFRGTVYQTNTSGQVIATPITETNLLLAAAAAGGTTDISSMALVYHIMGDSSHGDTIDVFNTSSRQQLTTLFGLYFADNFPDPHVDRTVLTNSFGTEIRRVDYIYTFNTTDYTLPAGASRGACFTTKRFLGDANGHVHTTIDGQMQWIVNPNGGAGTKICVGTFTTTKPF